MTDTTSLSTAIMRITPTTAAKMLDTNDVNRPVRDKTVAQYANDMSNGLWQVNGESIKLSCHGRLLDGQHRLRAVIKANKAVEMVVVKGLNEESFHTIDTGMRRTAAQIVGLAGHANATILASAARWIAILERALPTNAQITTQDMLDVITAHPLIHKYGSMLTKTGLRRLLTASTAGVFVLAAEKYGENIVDDFLNRFDSGEGLKKTDPVYELRERLISSRSSVAKLQGPTIVAITIKAIRAYASDKSIGVLRWSPTEEWPCL